MELFGDHSWWLPRWLDRMLPRLHIEARLPISTAELRPARGEECDSVS
jgi:uncharacterized membrane protein YdfJ with MMPL/SSD domain